MHLKLLGLIVIRPITILQMSTARWESRPSTLKQQLHRRFVTFYISALEILNYLLTYQCTSVHSTQLCAYNTFDKCWPAYTRIMREK